MQYAFAPQRHRVTMANYNFYINSVAHPDRIMNEHDFFYLTEGAWWVGQEGEHYEVFPDDVIIFPAGAHHYGVSDSLPRTRTIFMHAMPAIGDGFSNAEPGSIQLGTKISCSGYKRPKEILQEIVFVYWSDNEQKDRWLSALYDVLLCELLKIENSKTYYSPNNRLDEMLHMIYNNPQKFYTIKELAGIFKISDKTVVNLFNRHTGKPVHEYQMSKKIDMIKAKLLIDPHAKIKDIAKEYGFSDEFHLSRVFKKFTGISPRAYRHKPPVTIRSPAEPPY